MMTRLRRKGGELFAKVKANNTGSRDRVVGQLGGVV